MTKAPAKVNKQPKRATRSWQFNLRMTDEEQTRLRLLSEHYGISPTQLVLFLLKKEADKVKP